MYIYIYSIQYTHINMHNNIIYTYTRIYLYCMYIYIYSCVQHWNSNSSLTMICALNTCPVVKQNAIGCKNEYDSRTGCRWTTNHSSTKQIQTISFWKCQLFYQQIALVGCNPCTNLSQSQSPAPVCRQADCERCTIWSLAPVRPKASVRSANVTPQMQVHFCHNS